VTSQLPASGCDRRTLALARKRVISASFTRAAPHTLDAASFTAAIDAVSGYDSDLARIVADHGPPPFWSRPPGFATLVLLILEQQVSLASAKATYGRLEALARPLTPRRLLARNDAELRSAGVSRQKARYLRALALAVSAGALDIASLDGAPDDIVRERLVAITGIGPWTANIYLLSALRRPDIWPANDLALATAVREVKRLRRQPDLARMERIGSAFRPYRAVAARFLWHYYLSSRGKVWAQ